MIQHNSVNANLSGSQDKLEPATKSPIKVTLRFSSNTMGYANDATNFPQKLLLTNRQVANCPKSFENELSVN